MRSLIAILCFALLGSPFADATLIRHWKCQDNAASTVLLDDTANGNGTLAANSSTMSGVTGPGGDYPRALLFNGTSSQATLTAVDLTGTFTLSAWFKRTSTSSFDFILGNNATTEAFGFAGDALNFYLKATHAGAVSTAAHGMTTTNWNHLVVIRDSGDLVKVYVNGQLLTANLYSGTRSGTTSFNRVGNNFGNAWFAGYLADVRIYDTDESANVAAIYADGLNDPIAALGTPPNIASDKAGFDDFTDARLAEFEAHCPTERTTTYYFANAGNDSTGDGSESTPWATIAKAQSTLNALVTLNADMRFRFKRGDEWRETAGILTALDNVTIDDYGTGALPFWNRFTVDYLDAANVWGSQSGNRWQVAEANDIAWLRRKSDRLGETAGRIIARASSAADCSTRANSFFWGSNILYVNLGGTDPNTVDLEACISNQVSGVEFQGDGCRVENIRADGWGLDRSLASTQDQPFTLRAGLGKANLVKNCKGYISGSHVIAHNVPGAVPGGKAAFIGCDAGYTVWNSTAGETVFNTFTDDGDHETWFVNCDVDYGTLPSADWDYDTNKGRGQGFFGHVGSGGEPDCEALFLLNCKVKRSITPALAISGGVHNPTAATLGAARAFQVGCTYERQDFAMPHIYEFGTDMVYYGNTYRFRPTANAISALTNVNPLNGYLINSDIRFEGLAIDYALFNRSSGSYAFHVFHSGIRWGGTSGTVGIDYDIATNTTSAGAGHAAGSTIQNSVIDADAALTAYVGLVNASGQVANNALSGIDDASGQERGYNLATNTISLSSPYVFGLKMAQLIAAGTTSETYMPILDGSLYNRLRDAVPPDVGPLDFSSTRDMRGRVFGGVIR